MPQVRVIQGDCREVMRRLPTVDLIIADPPYGTTTLEWDRTVSGWAQIALGRLKPSGSMWVFGTLPTFLRTWHEFSGWKIAQDVIWEKHNGSGPAAHRRFLRVHEQLVQLYPKHVRWREVYAHAVKTTGHVRKAARRTARAKQRGEMAPGSYDSTERIRRSVLSIRSCHGHAVHPTQKPQDLLKILIEHSCPKGGTVLDPFAGSGSTLRAACAIGRSAIGIDLDVDLMRDLS